MKIRKHFVLILGLAVVGIISCNRIEEEISNDSGLRLTLSTDTVTFDTLFSTVGSITKRFRVFNDNENAIRIDRIGLGLGSASAYTLTVNGVEGSQFIDEVILGKDSLLVLVKVLINPSDQNLAFLVKDSVILDYNGNSAQVKLVSWGQDAIFISNEAIACNTTWTKERPYVIYDSAWIDIDCQLIIEAGARVYLDNNSFLKVLGKIVIEGTAEEKVVIRNTRLDPKYEIAPGQWDKLLFYPTSKGNIIDHAIIENGSYGMFLVVNLIDGESAEITIRNTTIRHMSQAGIVSYAGSINASNTEIFNCQNALLAHYIGGNYTYEHCTFSNYPNWFSREGPSLIFTDVDNFESPIYAGDLSLNIVNSIIWGSEKEELFVELLGSTSSTVDIQKNIIRSEQEDWLLTDNYISQEDNFPGFYSPLIFNYQLDSISNARDSANVSLITHDLLGTVRDVLPDLGAYERKDSIP